MDNLPLLAATSLEPRAGAPRRLLQLHKPTYEAWYVFYATAGCGFKAVDKVSRAARWAVSGALQVVEEDGGGSGGGGGGGGSGSANTRFPFWKPLVQFQPPLQRLTLSCELEHGDIVQLGQVSSLTRLTLAAAVGPLPNVSELAFLTQLRALEVAPKCKLGDLGMASMINLTGLESLAVPHNNLGREGAAAVAFMRGLRSLDISGNKIGLGGVAAVAMLTGLQSLTFEERPFNDDFRHDDVNALTALKGLTSLGISGLDPHDAAGHRLLPALQQLSSLTFSDPMISMVPQGLPTGLTSLVLRKKWQTMPITNDWSSLAALGQLRVLEVKNYSFGGGVEAIAGLTGITRLGLHRADLDDSAILHLRGLTNLKSLDIAHTKLRNKGVRIIASACTRLVELNMAGVEMYASGVRYLSTLQRLTALDISQNSVTTNGNGFRHLTRLTGLQSLDVSRNFMSGKCGDPFSSLAALTGLTSLNVTHAYNRDRANLSSLESLRPSCRIIIDSSWPDRVTLL